jgi:hypothetical protein
LNLSINIHWNDSLYDTILLKFEDDWGWLALRNQIRTVFTLMKKAPSATDLIFDLTSTDSLPTNPVGNLDGLRPHLPANLGVITLLVSAQSMYDTLLPLRESYAVAGLQMEIVLMQDETVHEMELPAVV